ncbi:MAG TPA: hypothetical protein VHU44_05395 [Acidobacteriaceae bacterium]|nr:hypothetical protein [Acidobacteriaceae bacterium]
MNCPSCSAPVEGQFCSRCGARLPPPAPAGYQYQAPPPPNVPPATGYAAPAQPHGYPMMPYVPRVQSHLRTLGILWCVYGGYRIFAGLAASIFLFGMSHSGFFDHFNPGNNFPFSRIAPMMGGIASMVLVMTIGGAALAFLTGFALLNRKPWGRTLAIVAAVLSLIKIPIGTALGIYTLWVLIPGQSGAEYEALADHS